MRFHSQLYNDLRPLDTRGDTRVWLARDRLGGHEVVRKRFAFDTPDVPEDFRRQLQLTRALADSGFVAAEDVYAASEREYDVSWRYIDRCAMETVLAEGGAAAFLDVLRQLSRSMEYCHALGFLHGDLKSDNILIERRANGFATAITDLEFNLRIGTRLLMTIQGAPGHIPPEMGAGEPLMEASDVFAFGRTVESYLRDTGAAAFPPAFHDLVRRCTLPDPAQRPATFQVVSLELAQIAAMVGGIVPSHLLPPLHPDVFRVRIERARRAIMRQGLTRVGLHLLHAAPGGGKSRVLRSVCKGFQLDGMATLRVTGVESYLELTKRLEPVLESYRGAARGADAHPPVVFVETAPGCRVSVSELRPLDQLARDLTLTVVAECRSAAPCALPAFIVQVPVPPLRTRECVAATSHLALSPAIAPLNGRALREATGGNPRLIALYMRRDRQINRGRRSPDPVDFDALNPTIDAYWQSRIAALSPRARSVLEWASAFHFAIDEGVLRGVAPNTDDWPRTVASLLEHGWLMRLEDRADTTYAFVCRSLRNVLRSTLGRARGRAMRRQILASDAWKHAGERLYPVDVWGLQCDGGRAIDQALVDRIRGQSGGVHDLKLVLWTMLSLYRRRRDPAPDRLAWLAVDIADGYSAYGSTRRERRWAALAIAGLQQQTWADRSGIEVLRATSRMYAAAGETEERTRWLRRTSASATDVRERAFLLSELSAVNILAYKLQDAQNNAYEAHHLLDQAELADGSEIYIRNLNRIGLSLTLSGQYESAQRYLNLGLSQARQHGFDNIVWRCVGNLGYVHRALGNVREAYRCARGVANYYRHSGELMSYVSGLRDQVWGLVESGRTNRALQVARLTVDRAMLTGDRSEQAWALNNLGWVLSMRGAAEDAFQALRNAIMIFRRGANAVPTANSLVNLAWLYLMAQCSERVRQTCQEALALAQSEDAGARAVQLELYRVLALADIQDDAYDDAARHVDAAVRLAAAEGSPKQQAEAALVELELTLWRGDERSAWHLINHLSSSPIVSGVHPLWVDFQRCKGHAQMMRGDFAEAHDTLSDAALAARRADRYDKHIDSLILLSRLSERMRNYHMALRFADIAGDMIGRVRKVVE